MTSNDGENSKFAIIEKQIGGKIRSLRLAQGLSVKQLGDYVGVAHTQILKYEKGSDRITISKLVMIAKALNEDVSYFYSDLENEMPKKNLDESQKMCIVVSRNFMKLKSEKAKDAINKLVAALVEMQLT